MTADLRDLMNRVADDAPSVDVDPATWGRARRARRRELLAVPALVAALVLGVLALALDPSALLRRVDLAPADGDRPGPEHPLRSGAVPTVIHAVPDAMDSTRSDGSWSTPRVPVSDIVRASAAYVTLGGGVVMVDARTGEHHLVDLPGFNDRFAGMEQGPMVALSSDGLRVAYSWRDPKRPPEGERWETGIAVIQVGLDRPTVHRLPDGVGVRILDIAWSPNGRFVVYNVSVLTAMQYESYTSASSSNGRRMERLDIFTRERVTVPRLGRYLSPPAVSDSGVVAVATGGAVRTWPATGDRAGRGGAGVWELGDIQTLGRAAWSADRRRLAVGSDYEPVTGVGLAEPARQRFTRVGEAEPGAIRVLGWVGPHRVAALRHDAGQWSEVQLLLVDVRNGATRVVGEVETGITLELGQLTVATDLMRGPRATVEFEPPSWETEWTWWWVGGGVLVLLAVGAVALVVVRRSRRAGLRRAPPATPTRA